MSYQTWIVEHKTTIVRTFHVTRDSKTAAQAAVECGPIEKVAEKDSVHLVDTKGGAVVKVLRTLREDETVQLNRTANMILAGLGDSEVTTLLRAAGIVPAKYDFERLNQLEQQLRK